MPLFASTAASLTFLSRIGIKRSFLVILGLALPGLMAILTHAQQALTNADVVKMVQAHLGVQVIVKQIQDNPGNYTLSTDALIKLHQQGVPDDVIDAMQAKKSKRTTPATSGSASTGKTETSSSDECSGGGGKWRIQDSQHGLSGAKREARYCQQFGHASAQLVASCDQDLTLEVGYFSADKELGFKISPNGLGATSVFVPLSISGAPPVKMRTTAEYKNQTKLVFSDEKTARWVYSTNPASDSAGIASVTQQKLFESSSVRIELPLNNGQTPVVQFNPQDPEFKEFYTQCPGWHPPAAPAPVVHVGKSSVPNASGKRMQISAGVARGNLITSPAPEYPADAKAAGTRGTVVLSAVIGADGTVLDLQPVNSPSPSLTAAAIAAVTNWRYRPYLMGGQPVEVATTINVSFP